MVYHESAENNSATWETDNPCLVSVNLVPIELISARNLLVFLPQQRTTTVSLQNIRKCIETNKKKRYEKQLWNIYYVNMGVWWSSADLNVVIVTLAPLSLTFRARKDFQFGLFQFRWKVGGSGSEIWIQIRPNFKWFLTQNRERTHHNQLFPTRGPMFECDTNRCRLPSGSRPIWTF